MKHLNTFNVSSIVTLCLFAIGCGGDQASITSAKTPKATTFSIYRFKTDDHKVSLASDGKVAILEFEDESRQMRSIPASETNGSIKAFSYSFTGDFVTFTQDKSTSQIIIANTFPPSSILHNPSSKKQIVNGKGHTVSSSWPIQRFDYEISMPKFKRGHYFGNVKLDLSDCSLYGKPTIFGASEITPPNFIDHFSGTPEAQSAGELILNTYDRRWPSVPWQEVTITVKPSEGTAICEFTEKISGQPPYTERYTVSLTKLAGEPYLFAEYGFNP